MLVGDPFWMERALQYCHNRRGRGRPCHRPWWRPPAASWGEPPLRCRARTSRCRRPPAPAPRCAPACPSPAPWSLPSPGQTGGGVITSHYHELSQQHLGIGRGCVFFPQWNVLIIFVLFNLNSRWNVSKRQCDNAMLFWWKCIPSTSSSFSSDMFSIIICKDNLLWKKPDVKLLVRWCVVTYFMFPRSLSTQ